ncbi:MAG: ParB/RepB/Spo0J family partition protein [Paraclostridium sp.]
MAKKTFNLKQLLNDKSIEHKEDKEEVEEANIYEFEVKTVDIDDIEPSQENFYNTKDIEDIKQSIELLGIEQNLIVTRYKDKYKLLAGHRRYFASKALVSEGKEAYRHIPCRIKKYKNDIYNKLTMIMTNSTARELSDWEKMNQLLETEKLVVDLKKEANIQGRTRDLLSEILNISPSQLARYKAIHNNLSEELKEQFKDNKITYTVAYSLSGLNEAYQEVALNRLETYKDISLQEVSELKKQEEATKQIDGQINIEDVEAKNEVSSGTIEEVIEEIDHSKENEIEQVKETEVKVEEVEIETESKLEKRVVHVIEDGSKKGCTFCNENCNFTITTENMVVSMDPLENTLVIINSEDGAIDSIKILYCPLCGRKL